MQGCPGTGTNSTTIATTRGDFRHLTRGGGDTRSKLSDEEIKRIPDILQNPQAILWDNDEKSLLYLFDAKGRKSGKLVVRI